MMLSKRLKTIADLVSKEDILADVGCDHAYLSIYLAQNNLCTQVIATEVVKGPYNIALNNIQNYHLEDKINLYLTDGLTGIKEQINTVVIAGMGTSTIIHILNNYDLKKVEKLIIQSNNDWVNLRKYFKKIGYYIETEINTYENKKDYLTFLARKTKNKNTNEEIIVGKYNPLNIKFYKRRIEKIKLIQEKIPNKKDIRYQELDVELKILENYLN